MGFRFSLRWCSTGGGPRGRCPPSWAGTRFFFWGSAPRGLCGDGCPCTHYAGAPPCKGDGVRLCLTLSPMRKSPKNLPEGAPLWVLPKGDASLPLRRCRNPLDRVSASNSDRFATLRWVGESVFFSPSVSARAHLLFSNRGTGRPLLTH